MGQPQDDELSGLRSELEGDPELADTFARLEPGANSGRLMGAPEFADPLAGLVPLDPPEPSTKLRASPENSALPKLHDEDGDRDTPTQRYVKTLHDLPDPSTRRVASDSSPPMVEPPKPLRTPSSYVGRIPRGPGSSPGGGPSAVPAGVPMRRPSGQSPMLSYSGSGRSLPQGAPVPAGALHPMSPENRFGAPTESQAASTLPAPEGLSSSARNAVSELPRSSTLPGAKGVVDSQSVPSTAVSPGVSSPASVPGVVPAPVDSVQESTDAGVSAPTELSEGGEGSEGDAGEANTKSSGRGAIYFAVGILSAAATLAVLLFVVKPMRGSGGAAASSSVVSSVAVPSAVVVPSVVVSSEAAAPSVVVSAAPSVSAAAASITADPVIVAGSASPSGGSSSSLAVPSGAVVAPVPSVTVTAVVVAPVPSPVVTSKPHSTGSVPAPKPAGSKISPIFDF